MKLCVLQYISVSAPLFIYALTRGKKKTSWRITDGINIAVLIVKIVIVVEENAAWCGLDICTWWVGDLRTCLSKFNSEQLI